MFDVAIDGDKLWTATGYGVQLFDRSGSVPVLALSVALSGLTRVVRASNGVAYAAGTNGISVIRRNGNSLQVVRSIAAGSVNDLALQGNALFAATTNRIIEFDLVDPLNPSRSSATFATSHANVTGIALSGSTLFAADGDSSVEAFSILVPSSPQPGTTLTSLPRASTIKAIGNRLFISDGQQTEVFAANGPSFTSVGTFPYPALAIAGAGSNVVFVAGNDRQIRAIDALIPQNYIELFDDELPPTAGTVNRINALQTAGGRLYVAGGDTGLTTYDISHFISPFPLRAYGIGSTTSVVVLPNAIFAGRSSTGIQEMTRSTTGGLTVARQWSGDPETMQDGGGGLLLTSTGAALKFWTVQSTIPTLISSATFRAAVGSAFLTGSKATALLTDGTLWTADMSQVIPLPVAVATNFKALSLLAHSSATTVATESGADGRTTIHSWNGDVNAAPVDATVAGIATALAIDGGAIAVFTFRGITLINGATQTVLPGSNASVINALQIANGKVIALTENSTLRIWDIATARLENEFTIPGNAVAIDAAQDSTVVGIATSKGVATVDYAASTAQPSLIARTAGNTYYRKAVASNDHLYLFDGRVIDVYEFGSSASPRWLSSIAAPAVIDLAASDNRLFTLTSTQIINEYGSSGALLRSNSLNEGSGVAPISITTVANAPWVSFSRGCTSTGCEKRTNVLDPQSLVRTAQFSGGVIDVATSGPRAYAIFDLPAETRIYNVSDNLHPSAIVSALTDVNAVAIAYNNGIIYLLADKAYAYNESSLTRIGDQLTPVPPSSSANALIDSGCVTIIGRSAAAENYTLPFWTAAPSMPLPGNARSLALFGGRILILTDYSIEIWSRTTTANNPKRHVVAP